MPQEVREGGIFGLAGASGFPIDPSIVEEMRGDVGYIAWGIDLLKCQGEEVYRSDPSRGATPAPHDFKSQCCRLHPGLCITRDEAVKDYVLKLNHNMGTYLHSLRSQLQLSAEYLRIDVRDENDAEQILVTLHVVIGRMIFKPYQFVLAPCVQSDVQDNSYKLSIDTINDVSGDYISWLWSFAIGLRLVTEGRAALPEPPARRCGLHVTLAVLKVVSSSSAICL